MRRWGLAAAVGLAVLWAACADPPEPSPEPVAGSAPAAVDTAAAGAAITLRRARAAHGSDVLDHATVSFSFRGTPFTVERDGGRFAYTRDWTDSTGSGRDVLTNDGLVRTVDGDEVPLDERAYRIAEEAVGSVVYFALLPYALADPAVQSRLAGADTLAGEPYRRVEVTFRQEGGGRDYQDRFLYWIHQDRATVDFLAYSYDDNGGGARFRQAVHPRTVGGVRFADYLNFSAEPLMPPLERLGRMWEADSLDLVSEIVLDDVQVVRGVARAAPGLE